jgi:hypothetical protein
LALRAGCTSSRHGFSPLLAGSASHKAAPNRYFIKVCRYQTKAAETEDQGDASHGAVATYRPRKAASNVRIREGARHKPRICQTAGGHVYFIK